MTAVTLSNGIPILFFKCEAPSAAIWFTKCGDCLDSYFGPVGLSHMLEHIYVKADDSFYTNGATFSSSVSFIAINEKKVKPISKLYEFLNSWFFEDGKLKDLIANHSIEDRIQELNRETGLKELQYGETLSIVDSLKTNTVSTFSKFDESFSIDNIRSALYKMLDYMLDPSRIIIAIGGPSDTRKQAVEIFNHSFGALKPTKITINDSHHHLSTSLNGLQAEDVLFFNYLKRGSVESSIIIPVSENSFLLKHHWSMVFFSSYHGDIVAINTLFDIISGSYKYFLEIRVVHRNIEHQLLYRDEFDARLEEVAKYYTEERITKISLDTFIMATPSYSSGIIQEVDMTIPKKSFYIFVTNEPLRNDKFLTQKAVPFKDVESDNIPTQTVPILERQQRFQRSCLLSLRKDLASTIAERKEYYTLYFPMSYECVLGAMMLQTKYPHAIYIEGNKIMTPYQSVYNYIANGTRIISDDIDRALMPQYLINLHTYCILESALDYNTAVMNLLYGQKLLNLTTSLYPIYYQSPGSSLDNDLFVFDYPFKYFIHVVNGDPGSYTQIIREIYKKSGLIYYGEMLYYNNYTVIRGIMN